MTGFKSLLRRITTRHMIVFIAVTLFLGRCLHIPSIHSLDLRFSYSLSEVYGLFDSLGESGRKTYFWMERIDLAYMTSYTLVCLSLFDRIYRKTLRVFPTWNLILCLAPGFLDLIETLGILILLRAYPTQIHWLALTVTVATPLKWSSGVLVFAAYFWRLWVSRHFRTENGAAPQRFG